MHQEEAFLSVSSCKNSGIKIVADPPELEKQ